MSINVNPSGSLEQAAWNLFLSHYRAAMEENLQAVPVRKTPILFPPLESVTKPNITTKELAYYTNMAEQTWRLKACKDTTPPELRPLRICGRLAWPTAGAKKFLGVS